MPRFWTAAAAAALAASPAPGQQSPAARQVGISLGNPRVRSLEFQRIEPPVGVGEVQEALGNAEHNLYFLRHCRREDQGRAQRAASLMRALRAPQDSRGRALRRSL